MLMRRQGRQVRLQHILRSEIGVRKKTISGTGLAPRTGRGGSGGGGLPRQGGGEAGQAPMQPLIAEWRVCEFVHDRIAKQVLHPQCLP